MSNRHIRPHSSRKTQISASIYSEVKPSAQEPLSKTLSAGKIMLTAAAKCLAFFINVSRSGTIW
jgi:hypothetical protein